MDDPLAPKPRTLADVVISTWRTTQKITTQLEAIRAEMWGLKAAVEEVRNRANAVDLRSRDDAAG